MPVKFIKNASKNICFYIPKLESSLQLCCYYILFKKYKNLNVFFSQIQDHLA